LNLLAEDLDDGKQGRSVAAADLLDGWDASAARKPQKRSMTIAGHRTSISLEEPFWRGLKAIAAEKDVSIAMLVAAIDAVRGEVSLSTAVRLYVHECGMGKRDTTSQ
jgi:predicted DNA-binding ribbon-helix-helix protein